MKEYFEKIKERLENEVQYQQQNANIISGNFKVSGKQARLKMGECYEHAIEIVNQVAEEYEKDIVGGSKKPKYVSIGAYKQVAWERDIAIEQLHELGYDFGQKIDVPDKNIGETDGWIPCSERLPENKDLCWLTNVWSDGTRHVTYDFYIKGGGWYDTVSDSVLAWMPINKPAPYQPKGEK